MSSTAADCLFCRIVAGQLPADVVAATDTVVAFRDIAPQAPVHVLLVPRTHYGDVGQLASADSALLADLIALGDEVAQQEANGQYRLVFNTGPEAGQSVFHVHGHVIAGAPLGWTPA